MRILLIHASKFSFHVTEKTSAVSSLAELGEDQSSGSVGDVLVAFMASEKTDEKGDRLGGAAGGEHHRRPGRSR